MSRRKVLILAGAATALIAGGGIAALTLAGKPKGTPAGKTILKGSFERGAATTPDGKFVWIGMWNSPDGGGGLLVVDTVSNSVVNRVSLTAPPESIAFTPDGKFAYLADSFKSTVSVVETATYRVVAQLNVADYWYQKSVTVSPNGLKAYATDSYGDKVSIIDTRTNRIIDQVSLGGSGNAWDIAVSADSRFAYVTRPSADSVTVIDTSSDKSTATLQTGRYPRGVATSSVANRAYVANGSSRSVSVVDTISNSIVTQINVEGDPDSLAITRDGGRVLVIGTLDTVWSVVSIIDTASASVIASLKMGYELASLAPDGAGKQLYLTDNGLALLTVVDLSTGAAMSTP